MDNPPQANSKQDKQLPEIGQESSTKDSTSPSQAQPLPNLDSQKIVHEEQREERLNIPDRSLNVTDHQINFIVQSGEIYDVNQNPNLVNEYIQPPPKHVRKIAFFATNCLGLILLIINVTFVPSNEAQAKYKDKTATDLAQYFVCSILNIIMSLVFYYGIRKERIMKHAHHFLLLNVHPMNFCLDVFQGYLISDFAFIILPIALIFLIINSIKIWRQNHEINKKKKLIDQKCNKLLEDMTNQTAHSNLSQRLQKVMKIYDGQQTLEKEMDEK